MSFVDETRVFLFDAEGGVEELDQFQGFSLTERTLVAANVTRGRLLQVTPTAVRLVDAEGGTVISEAFPDAGNNINIASANENTLLYAMGSTVVLTDLSGDLRELGRREFEYEVSCVNIPESSSAVCVVGLWTSSAVLILSSPTLATMSEEILGGVDSVAIPRSLLLARVIEGGPPTLLVAMGDGTLFTFSVNENDCSLSQKKSIILGTQSMYFQTLAKRDGLVNVFATSDHPSLIYGSEGRIMYSAVTADKATHVTAFNARTFPGAVVVATEGDLKLALVDPLRTIHVQTLPIGDLVRRIAHSKEKKLFGVATIHLRTDLATGDDRFKCFFRVVDEVVFGLLDSIELNDMELVECLVCAKMGNGDGTFTDRFMVGTGYQDPTKDECEKGRIIVIEVSEEKKLKVATQLEVKGAVKGLQMVEGKLVATLNKAVGDPTHHSSGCWWLIPYSILGCALRL